MPPGEPHREFGPFRLSFRPKRLAQGGAEVPLTPKALDTLAVLVSRPGELIEKQDLMKAVWGDVFVDESTLTQNIFTIRKVLGEGSYIETVPRRGYRFIAPVREIADERKLELKEPPDVGQFSGAVNPARSRVLVIGLVVGLAVVAASGAWLIFDRKVQHPVRSLVVLPFANLTGDSSKDYFSDGLTEEIINGAAGIPGLRVVARTTAFQFKGKGEDVRKIGEELQADAILEGSVRWDETRLRITAQLNTTKDGYHLWSRTWDRQFKDVIAVQQEIAEAVVSSLTGHKGPLPRNRRPTDNFEAYQLYLEGRFYRERVFGGSLEKAINRLQGAIALDPNFAAAYAMLSDCYLDLGYTSQVPPRIAYPKAAQAARRAIELDDASSYAHSVMGLIHLYFDWDWSSAEPELRRAIELDPEDANTYHYYSHYLVSASRFPESLEMSKQALDLDPIAARLLGHRTWNQSWARNLPEAIEVGQKVVDLHPEAGACCGAYLVMAYEQAKDYQKAINERERFGMPKDAATKLRQVLNQNGPDGYWQALLERNLSNTGYVGAYFRARLYANMNQADEAFHWLGEAIEQRDSWLVYLKVDPAFDSVRSDPRFSRLVRTVGIPPR